MDTEVLNKEELLSLSESLNSQSDELVQLADDLKSRIEQVESYDEFDISGAATVLANNLEVASGDLEVASANINSYANQLITLDVNDFGSKFESYLAGISGNAIYLPEGLGKTHTYMGWQCITSPSSMQYKLREAAGMNFDEEGYAKIGDRYVVATTTTFGQVGDYIDVVQSDGSVIKCIIGDIKNQNDSGCNQWGHINGQCVVEFVVDKNSWYGIKDNPGTPSNHPEWSKTISQIVNKGNYFNLNSGNEVMTASAKTPTPQAQSAATSSDNSYVAPAVVATVATDTTAYAASGSNPASTYETVSYDVVKGNTNPTPTVPSGSEPIKQINTSEVTISSGDPNIDISKYHNNINAGFEVTVGNTAYNLSEGDYNLLCAIVAAESDKSYDDALAVITTILNRCEAPNWIASHGTSPISQATAPNQFVVYQHGSYKSYLGNAPETVMTAVRDALAGVRNHNYLSFRSNGSTGYSSNMITQSGNRYK